MTWVGARSVGTSPHSGIAGSFGDQTFLANDPPLQVLIVLAVIGAVLCGVRRVRFGMAMTMVAVAFAALFLLLPEGRLWNVRLLPYYYLAINFMAAIAVAEIGRLLASVTRSFGLGAARRCCIRPAALASLVVFIAFGLTLRSLRVAPSTIRVATRGWVCSRPPSAILGRSGLRTISTVTSARVPTPSTR